MQSGAGRELYERGWRQGCLVPLRPVQTVYETIDPPAVKTIEPEGRTALVLTTQDCDLVKTGERLPFVEAIAATHDAELSNEVQINDTRYFVLNPVTGLVADRVYNVTIEKDALLALPPPDAPCGGDETRTRRFAKWLGLRYDRIPLPDDVVLNVQRPLADAFRKLCRPGKRYESLNRDLREIRIIGDLSQGPPFLVSLIFVLTEEASIEDASLAIAAVITDAGFAIEGGLLDDEQADVQIRRWVAVPPSRLPVKVYHESIPVSLERISVRGEETIGAVPLNAESA
jgi:hypothetical protein